MKWGGERRRMIARVSRRVQLAIQRRELMRPMQCEQCGVTGFIEAAHHDYSRPLAVRWLCRRCHRTWDYYAPKATVIVGSPERLTVCCVCGGALNRSQRMFCSHSCQQKGFRARQRYGSDFRQWKAPQGQAGERNANAKLTGQQVSHIRSQLAEGKQRARLAKEYGVNWSTIDAIATGRTWFSSETDGYAPKPARSEREAAG